MSNVNHPAYLRQGPTSVGESDAEKAAVAMANAASRAYQAACVAMLEERRKEWQASPFYCSRCNGSGSIVVWGTLDSVSGCYDEYGPCPGVADSGQMCAARKEGARTWTGSNEGRLSGHPQVTVPPLVQSKEERSSLDDLLESYDLAIDNLFSVAALWKLQPGCQVRVFKGRKVPIGTTGKVFGLFDSSYGINVGIQPDGVTGYKTGVFTSVDNVMVIKPSADGQEMLPKLYGSEKQVAWANKIRRAAIDSGKVTVAEARNIYESRVWIDRYR